MRIISLIFFLLCVISQTNSIQLNKNTSLLKNVFTVKKNETVSLKCPINNLITNPIDNDFVNNEFLMVQWFKDSFRINKLTLPERYALKNTNDADLYIKNVQVLDSGNYKCRVINGYGSITHKFRINVETDSKMNNMKEIEKSNISFMKKMNRPKLGRNKKYSSPVFIQPKNIVIKDHIRNVGGFIQFDCRAIGTPKPDILWFRNGEILSEEDYGITRSKWRLNLKDIRMTDKGNYTCQVFNKIGYINATFSLSVYTNQPQIPEIPQIPIKNQPEYINTTIIADMDAILECRIKHSASNLPSVKWMKKINKFEYDNYVLQNNIDAVNQFNTKNIHNEQSEIHDMNEMYKLNTKSPLYWPGQLPQENDLNKKPSSFYSLSDLIGLNGLNNKLDSIKSDDFGQLNIKKRSILNSDESAHYITLTSSLSTEQKLKFNRKQGVYISQLIIKQATVKDTGVYVCFLDGQKNGKAFLNVLPNHFEPNMDSFLNKPDLVLNKPKKLNDYFTKDNVQSIGMLIFLIPMLLITAFAIASICYLKNVNKMRKRNSQKSLGIFEVIKKCCQGKKSQLNNRNIEKIPNNKNYLTSTMINNKSPEFYKSHNKSHNNKSCSEAGRTTNTSFSDTSLTSANTVPYYATVPLLENSPPPPLPNTQPPCYKNSENSNLVRSESTPSMAYYKIVENELFNNEEELATLPNVQNSCENQNSNRVYYQVAPNYINNSYQTQSRYGMPVHNNNNINSNNFYV